MMRRVVGVAITSDEVRAAEVVLGRVPQVRTTCAVALPERAVVWGAPTDADAVAETLATAWAKGGFESKDIVISIDARQAVLRVSEFPELNAHDLQVAAKLDIEELLPFSIDDAVINVMPIDTYADGEQIHQRSLVIAVPRSVVATYREIAARIGLKVVGFDVVPLSMIRSVVDRSAAERHAEDGPYADLLVEIGSDVTHLVVRSAGRARFVRVLTTGVEDESAVMASELEAQLNSIASFRGHSDEPKPDTSSTLWHPVVVGIRSTIDYYNSLPQSPPLAGASVTGSGLDMASLTLSLESLLGIPVVTGAVIGVQDAGIGTPGLVTAVGAALSVSRGVQNLDLRTPEERVLRSHRRQLVAGFAIAALAAGILGMDARARQDEVRAAESAADGAERQLAVARAQPVVDAVDLGSLPTDVGTAATQLQTVLQNDFSMVELLDRLAAAVPEHTFLTTLNVERGATGATPVGTTAALASISVQGSSPDHAGVADWLANVSGLAFTDDGWVNSSRIEDNQDASTLGPGRATFAAEADLTQPLGTNRLARYLVPDAADLPIGEGS